VIRDSFNDIDKDKSGAISLNEMKQYLGSNYTDEQAIRYVKLFDKDSNGSIDLQEFVNFHAEILD
jgi:Ca2+-binding EF-hand superfamily protein